METQLLKNLGLSEAEIKVYVTLLKTGLSTTGEIIKQSRLQKSTVYYSLHDLEYKGLVLSSLRNGVSYFKAENPEILLEKTKELEQESHKLVKLLKTLRQPKEKKLQSMISEGFKSVVSALQHRLGVLNKGDEILIFGSLAASPKTKAAVLAIQKANKEAVKKGIKIKVVFNEKLKNSKLAKFYRSLPKTKIKYIKEKTPVGMAIYKDFIYTLVWTDPRNPTSVLTQSKIIAEMYKVFFEDLWKKY